LEIFKPSPSDVILGSKSMTSVSVCRGLVGTAETYLCIYLMDPKKSIRRQESSFPQRSVSYFLFGPGMRIREHSHNALIDCKAISKLCCLDLSLADAISKQAMGFIHLSVGKPRVNGPSMFVISTDQQHKAQRIPNRLITACKI